MSDVTFERGHTAVLIADFYAEMMNTLPHATGRGVVQKASAIQAAARDAGVMVCYCATVFRPGYPEIGQRNKTFSRRKASGQTAIPTYPAKTWKKPCLEHPVWSGNFGLHKTG